MEETKITTEEKKEYTPRPKWAFDSEYSTERLREVQFLTEKGIPYTYVRTTPDYNVSQYKYRKTPALFAALVEFYTRLDIEREQRARKRIAEVKPEEKEITPEAIKTMQETLAKYAAQISKKNSESQDDTE